MKYLHKMALSTCVLTGYSLFPSALAALAQISNPTIEFIPPPLTDRGRTYEGRSRGAASRGDCRIPDNQTGLTSLTPVSHTETNNSAQNLTSSIFTDYESVFSLTTDASPSFWFYVPYSQTDNVMFEFIFQDANGNTLHQQQFLSSSDSPGIIQVSFPETVSPLAFDESYQWYFLAHCTSDSASVSPYVSGWISRVQTSPEIQKQLDTASPLEQAIIYAANGIWQNSLTILGELHRESPADDESSFHWKSLLSSTGLNELSDSPLID